MIRLLEVFSLGVVVAACLVGQGNSASSSDAFRSNSLASGAFKRREIRGSFGDC